MRRLSPLVVALAACGAPARSTPTAPVPVEAPTGPHASQVAAQVEPYLKGEVVDGVVVALVDADRTEIYGFARDGQPRPGAETVFDLGGVTQVFTALLLGDAVRRGELTLDAPLAHHVPLGVQVPGDPPITVGHLATHTSGLPPVPPSLLAKSVDPDPYAGYTAQAMYDDLARARTAGAPGQQFVFSMFGYALLGHALAHAAHTDWDRLVQARLLGPLGLRHTYTALPAAEAPKLAPGHDPDLRPAPRWGPSAMGPAIAMSSTAADLVAFARANLDAAAGGKGALADVLRDGQEVAVRGGETIRALAWFVDGDGRRWYNGGTGGHHVFVGFDPDKKQAVIVLADTSISLLDRLGGALFQVLAGDKPDPVRFPDAAALAALAGSYQLQGAPLTVEVKGARLYASLPGDPATRLVPLSATEFWIEDAQAVVAFEMSAGKAARIHLLLGGQQVTAERQ